MASRSTSTSLSTSTLSTVRTTTTSSGATITSTSSASSETETETDTKTSTTSTESSISTTESSTSTTSTFSSSLIPSSTSISSSSTSTISPTPTIAAASATSTSTSSDPLWTTSSIIIGAVALGFLVTFILSIIAFICLRRRDRNRLSPEHRPITYNPFRSASRCSIEHKASLLDNITPVDSSLQSRRPSMFNGDMETSASLLVKPDANAARRVSMDSLIPVQVSPTDRYQLQDPAMASRTMRSNGSGAGSLNTSSSRYSVATPMSAGGGLSPIAAADSSPTTLARTRPRSTISMSANYYANISPTNSSSNRNSNGIVGSGYPPNTRPISTSSTSTRYYVRDSDTPAVPSITIPTIVRRPVE